MNGAESLLTTLTENGIEVSAITEGGEILEQLREDFEGRFDVVFIDECHRALARSYRDLAARYPDAIHVGLTATPYRADGRGLGDACLCRYP